MKMNPKRWLAFGAAAILSIGAVGIAAAQQGGDGPGRDRGSRVYLGVTLNDVETGVEVVEVLPESPAADAGIEAGDIITAINGETIDTPADARRAVQALAAGDVAAVEIERDNEPLTLEITVETAADQFGDGQVPGMRFFQRGGGLDLSYNPETGEWTVGAVDEESALYTAGLREGDVITAIDGQSPEVGALVPYLRGLADDADVTITLNRDGETLDITVPVSELGLFRFDGRGNRGLFDGMRPFGDRDGGSGFGFGGRLAGVRLGVGFESTADGATVTEVIDGLPAAAGGIVVGDVITAVNGETVNEEITLRDRIGAYEAGDSVTLTVVRDGEPQEITIMLPEPQDIAGMLPFMQGEFPFGQGGEPMPPAALPEGAANL
ncbi:MAG: PDZ domain-containing protein [bacterium]|nr:PDZ domain-containing protein [bacterium]